ncbi:MAG: cytidylate kinase-like family protein [Clostridiales bacterium]|nr:cytidylate kinase-like family protein [Clostridiales bacterium]
MKHRIITICHQYSSGGGKIGHLLAQRLGIPCYDGSIIDKAAQVSELSPDFIRQNEQHLSNSFLFDVAMTVKIYKAEADVIKDCARKGSCVIVGRCADKVLEKEFPCLKVFLSADFDDRCRRAVTVYGKAPQEVQSFLQKADRGRERFYRRFHETEWRDASNYHLCLNTGLLGEDGAAALIEQVYRQVEEGTP